jgi:hypothetical protein
MTQRCDALSDVEPSRGALRCDVELSTDVPCCGSLPEADVPEEALRVDASERMVEDVSSDGFLPEVWLEFWVEFWSLRFMSWFPLRVM